LDYPVSISFMPVFSYIISAYENKACILCAVLPHLKAQRGGWAMQGLESLLLKMWANGSFLFSKLDIKSSQSDPAVMVQLRGETTGTWSFSITVKSPSTMSEGTTEKCEYLHEYNTQGKNKWMFQRFGVLKIWSVTVNRTSVK
jgi:hypothetical protein